MMTIKRTLHPLMMNWQRVLLDSLLLAIEMGDCRLMSWHMETGEQLGKRSDFAPFLTEYEQLVSRAKEALAYEDLNGKHSMLNMTHPLNQQLLAMGYPRGAM